MRHSFLYLGMQNASKVNHLLHVHVHIMIYACTGTPPATDTSVESLEDSTTVAPEDKGMEDDDQQQQQASELNLEPSASLAPDSRISPPASSPETAKSADMTETESVHDVTLPAEDQSKGRSSPVVTSPQEKPSHPSAESAETAFAKWTRDEYIVSIPLSLVRLSRKSKSRSSSKDLGGKLLYTTRLGGGGIECLPH